MKRRRRREPIALGTVGDHPELLGPHERETLVALGNHVWCLHCERWQPKTSLRLMEWGFDLTGIPSEGPLVICSYEDCDGTLLDIWDHDTSGQLQPPPQESEQSD